MEGPVFSKLFNRKKPITIQSEPAGDWMDEDGYALYKFINGRAGIKLMANLRFTLYREIMDPNKFDEWHDARRAAFAQVIDAIEECARKPQELWEEIEEEE